MALLIIGLILFFAAHSVRIIAEPWRNRFIAEKGKNAWRGLYSLVSLAGLVLIVIGYGMSRADPVFLWNPPVWTRHVTALLVLFAFFLIVAGNIPKNHLREKLGHPMFLGIKTWAFAHLIANGRLGDVLLFGAFLVWAIVGYSAARKRDRLAGVVYEKGTFAGTATVSSVGTLLYALFAFKLHELLIGVPTF